MSEHLRHLSRHARIPVSVMPNAGLPVLGPNGAEYPLQPDELAEALAGFIAEFGLSLVGGCCGTTPEHIRRVAEAVRTVTPANGTSPTSRRCRRCTPRSRSSRKPRCW
ncbi:homocysteine S-methyltransferase family protein [Mycobacterium xenopi 3993]|nr:homocysteine S-methyltransferase family protein [Mycobacterium xenopi 3993]